MSSAGSLIGSDASRGTAEHAPTTSAKIHGIVESSQRRAPRMLLFPIRASSQSARVFANRTEARTDSLVNRIGQVAFMLAVAGRNDCYLLASDDFFLPPIFRRYAGDAVSQ